MADLPNAAEGCAGDGNREQLVWSLFEDVLHDRLYDGWLSPTPVQMMPETQQMGQVCYSMGNVVIQPRSATVLQCHSATVPQCYNVPSGRRLLAG